MSPTEFPKPEDNPSQAANNSVPADKTKSGSKFGMGIALYFVCLGVTPLFLGVMQLAWIPLFAGLIFTLIVGISDQKLGWIWGYLTAFFITIGLALLLLVIVCGGGRGNF